MGGLECCEFLKGERALGGRERGINARSCALDGFLYTMEMCDVY